MNQEEAKQAIEIMKAFADGKEVEYRPRYNWSQWCKSTSPDFNWQLNKYRIKPKQTYRPFKDMKECWNEMLKHQPFGWLKSKDKGEYKFRDRVNKHTNFDYYYTNYTFVDGSPFGIKED